MRFIFVLFCWALACACVNPSRVDLTKVDSHLQARLEKIDSDLRAQFVIAADQTALGLIDLKTSRVAMIQPDRIEYAASVAKIGILYAWLKLHPGVPDAKTRHELSLMIKASSNEMATRFSKEMGLAKIQEILNADGFYDASRGGGIWVGKHYGVTGERIPDPVGGNSHAVTVRQVLRFYMLVNRDPVMRSIFESPEIPHDEIKFVKGLAGRDLRILRKWGSWEEWLHDSALIEGPKRAYILVALVRNKNGDAYLEALAHAVDDLLM